jgi:radical SAM superfamily enzyme YgiQ (UPF0313 family)
MGDFMKILLVAINAKYIHTNLAIYSLRAYAEKYQDSIELAEYTINHHAEDILKGIYKKNADVIAFSCYIWNIEMVTRVVKELKKVRPKAKLWFGGPEVSYDPKECLKIHKEWDGILIGEGEQTFLELLEYYIDQKRELNQIPGLAYKKSAYANTRLEKPYTAYLDKKTDAPVKSAKAQAELTASDIIITEIRQPLSMDELPFPYKDLEGFRNKIIYYESSRGCPFSCSYCLSSIDKRVRHRKVELVKEELQFFLNHKIPQVKFVDRTFNCNKSHAMEIWRFIKERDNGITNFHFEIAADLLGDEELELLAGLRPGQIQLEIGVQSTNPDTISVIHRKMDLDKLGRNVGAIREGHNIHQHLDLIAGLPLEDYQSFSKSFQEVYKLKPDQLQLGFLKVLKGSLMEEEVNKYGIIHQSTPPYEVLKTNQLSYDQVLLLKGACDMVEIYYNSGQFQYSMQFIEHFFETPMQMYQELSNYYEKTNMELMAHSRIQRYEILLEFYKNTVLNVQREDDNKELEEVFKDILVFDLYLREDMKSRPSFAQPVNSKRIREAYDEIGRKDIHIELFSYDIAASCEKGSAIKKEIKIIFDYCNRDPLNKSAGITILE